MQGLPFKSREIEAAIDEALDELGTESTTAQLGRSPLMTTAQVAVTTKKDWTSDQEVRWCPGCGDYGILLAVQTLMPELGTSPENTVFLSGIGCSSRFPYYMNTYGMHSIHGRAPAIATGVAVARPDLDVWVITGDGDGLSIGGNHLIHALRRNVNLNILLFNNRIYGLTKGQYSPTSPVGKVTKSTPMGSIDPPFNPLAVALGAEASFVARTHDLDRQHMIDTFRAAHAHRGTSFVEIYQNCNVFNDGQFEHITKKQVRDEMMINLVHGEPVTFGADGQRGVVMGTDGQLRLVELADVNEADVLVHDAHRAGPVARVRAGEAQQRRRITDPVRRLPRHRPSGVRGCRRRAGDGRQRREGSRRPLGAAAVERHLGRRLKSLRSCTGARAMMPRAPMHDLHRHDEWHLYVRSSTVDSAGNSSRTDSTGSSVGASSSSSSLPQAVMPATSNPVAVKAAILVPILRRDVPTACPFVGARSDDGTPPIRHQTVMKCLSRSGNRHETIVTIWPSARHGEFRRGVDHQHPADAQPHPRSDVGQRWTGGHLHSNAREFARDRTPGARHVVLDDSVDRAARVEQHVVRPHRHDHRAGSADRLVGRHRVAELHDT